MPPLAVVGLTLESGSVIQSLGALLLFLTNVVAIVGTGIIVMSFYGVNKLARFDAEGTRRSLARPIALLAVMLVLVGLPLTLSSVDVASRTISENAVQAVADEWGADIGWKVVEVTSQGAEVFVRLEGPMPLPDTASLKEQLDAAAIDPSRVTVNLVPTYTVELD